MTVHFCPKNTLFTLKGCIVKFYLEARKGKSEKLDNPLSYKQIENKTKPQQSTDNAFNF